MTEALDVMRKSFEEKGKELQHYKEEYKIKIAGEEGGRSAAAAGGEAESKKDNAPSAGVLVT